MEYRADVFKKVFGPRVVLEGAGEPSDELKSRAATPAINTEIVKLEDALAEGDDDTFDSERDFIKKFFSSQA